MEMTWQTMDLDRSLFLPPLFLSLPLPQVKTDLCAYGKEGKILCSWKKKSEKNVDLILSYFCDSLMFAYNFTIGLLVFL